MHKSLLLASYRVRSSERTPTIEHTSSGFQSKGEPSTSDSPFPYSSSANESDAISLGDEMSIGIVNFESHKGIYGF